MKSCNRRDILIEKLEKNLSLDEISKISDGIMKVLAKGYSQFRIFIIE